MKIKKTIKKNVLKLIPIRRYDFGNECYIYDSGMIMDIVKMNTKDIVTMSESDIEYDMSVLASFFRSYKDDIKLIAINIPTNCQSQISFLRKKIDKCTDEFKLTMLREKLEEQEWIEKNRTDKEYVMMYFAKNIEEFKKLKDHIQSKCIERKMATLLGKAEKDKILKIINNKNERY